MIPEVKTFLLAMTPIGELRAALPVALTVYHLDWKVAYLISVIGNIIPPIIILLALGPIANWLSKKVVFFQKFFNWLFERTRRKYNGKIKKTELAGLTTFVAIPLPITGGWTGSLIAFLSGIPFKLAFPPIAAGVIIAGIIVLIATKLGIAIEAYFGWKTLFFTIFLVVVVYLMFKTFKKPKK